MSKAKIIVRTNGPFRIEDPEGVIELVDHEGKPFELEGKTVYALCRCGHSGSKPFCDGSHKTCTAPAPAAAEQK